jgi:hypothetical protein
VAVTWKNSKSPPLSLLPIFVGGEVNNFAQRNVKKWETKSTKDEFTRGIAQRHQRYVTHTQCKTKLAKQKKEEFKSSLFNNLVKTFSFLILLDGRNCSTGRNMSLLCIEVLTNSCEPAGTRRVRLLS